MSEGGEDPAGGGAPPPPIPALEEFARLLAVYDTVSNAYHIEEALGFRISPSRPQTSYPPEGLVAGIDHPWLRARLHELAKHETLLNVALRACDLLRAYPEERADVEAFMEARALRDVLFGSALLRYLLRGDADAHARLARLVSSGHYVGWTLEEMASAGEIVPVVVRAAKEAIESGRLERTARSPGQARATLEQALFWLNRAEGKHLLRGARLDAFLAGLVAHGIVPAADKKRLRSVPADQRSPERVLATVVEPRAVIDARHASEDDWTEVARKLGVEAPSVAGSAATAETRRMFMVGEVGDFWSVILLTDAQAAWLKTQELELIAESNWDWRRG
jgi:hypothetical protein